MIKLGKAFINLIHILFVAPLLASIALGTFPDQYKQYLLYLAVFIFIYHGYCLLNDYGYNLEFMRGGHHIKMFDSSPGFEYPVYHITEGETVVWENVGNLDKTITSADDTFHSGLIKARETFSMIFPKAGVFDYYSIPQKGWMIGQIIVEPKQEMEPVE